MSDINRSTSQSLSTQDFILIRDFSLSPDFPFLFCIRLLLQEMKWTGKISQLSNLLGRHPSDIDLVDARNLFLRLGYNSQISRLHDFEALSIYSLPAIYIDPSNIPFVLFVENDSTVLAGNAFGRFNTNQLESGGILLTLGDIKSNDEISVLKHIFYRFSNKISKLYWISFAIALLALAMPLYIRAIYNIAIPSRALISSLLLFAGIGILFVLDFNLRQWRTILLSQMGGKLDSLLGMRVAQKFLGLDYSQIKTFDFSNYNTRIRNLDGMLNYLVGPLSLALLEFPFVIIYLLAIYLISGGLVLVPILVMLISGVIVLFLSKYYIVAEELNIKTSVGILQAQQELVRSFKEVKLAHLEWAWVQRLRALSGESTKSGLILNKQAGLLQILISTSTQLAGALTLAIGAWIFFANAGSNYVLGNLIAAMFIVWRVFTPFQYLMNALLRFDTVKNQYIQLDRFLKLRSNITSKTNFGVTHSRLFGSIRLDSVSCRLSSGYKFALTNVNLEFTPGEINAITGKSGCGKTVVLNVISQLFPVTSGTISFDGIDCRQFAPEDLQGNISFVMNNSQFLPGSLRDNLFAVNPDARIDDLFDICNMLGILDFINSLPKGFDTELTYDINYIFPVGMQKLLSLAQALIKDSSILLIDDISQGLSTAQFQYVLNALPCMRKCWFSNQERSIIMTTSNNLLLKSADKICILDKGVSTFQGTYGELESIVQSKS